MKKLGTISDIVMGTSPKGNYYNQIGEGLPLLNGPTEFGPVYPDVTLFTSKSIKECQVGDLLFCVRGSTTGRMNWADRDYSIGRGICLIRTPTKGETKFVRYALEYRLPALLQLAGGATFPNLPKETIAEFQIPFPKSRDKIASVLSAYDDLIENNLRRIKLLEESARMLYKEWFVRLRFPGYEHTRIIKGVPEGWKMATVGSLATVKSGFAFKSKDWISDGNPVIKIKNINDGEIDTSSCDFIADDVAERAIEFLLNPGDLIIAMTGATVGKVGIMPRTNNRYFLNQRVGLFKSKVRYNPIWFLYIFFRDENARAQVMNYAAGAAQPNISPTQIGSIKLLIGKDSLMQMYSEYCDSMFSQILTLVEQNRKLKQARNLLLPRLMNGEVEV
jgi:type I restriction enzyme S subunit